MGDLEQLLGLFVAAVMLAAAARRVGAPYPVFLALGGSLLAFLPGAPSFAVPPELALAIFVAPVLLDAGCCRAHRARRTPSGRSSGGPAGSARHACQQRDRRRRLSSD
ncbi:MAG TPA: hypothetical protein VH679_14210 [Vicinamibacterales bacterium]|jgi:NhaP-type Na+/H+ or K+/H+ antiporter